MCTRRENLKRHSRRFHRGQGEALLRYISGNSILVPENTPSDTRLVFKDEIAKENMEKNLSTDSTPKSIIDTLSAPVREFLKQRDHILAPIREVMELHYSLKSDYTPYNHTSPPAISPAVSANPSAIHERFLMPTDDLDIVTRPVSKIDVCQDCLSIMLSIDEPNYSSTERKHVCVAGTDDLFYKIGASAYFAELCKTLNYARALSQNISPTLIKSCTY